VRDTTLGRRGHGHHRWSHDWQQGGPIPVARTGLKWSHARGRRQCGGLERRTCRHGQTHQRLRRLRRSPTRSPDSSRPVRRGPDRAGAHRRTATHHTLSRPRGRSRALPICWPVATTRPNRSAPAARSRHSWSTGAVVCDLVAVRSGVRVPANGKIVNGSARSGPPIRLHGGPNHDTDESWVAELGSEAQRSSDRSGPSTGEVAKRSRNGDATHRVPAAVCGPVPGAERHPPERADAVPDRLGETAGDELTARRVDVAGWTSREE
jgi:hypothetical protein